jgi:hypothetical protein
VGTFNPKKLNVTFIPPATSSQPLDGRKYTLTHSDKTGLLFLKIGNRFDLLSINLKLRDEVLAKWVNYDGTNVLQGYVYVSGGEYTEEQSRVRFNTFRKELGTELTAIVYGDRKLYKQYSMLLNAPIYVHFVSVHPAYDQVIQFGTPRQFLTL